MQLFWALFTGDPAWWPSTMATTQGSGPAVDLTADERRGEGGGLQRGAD